MEDNSLVTTPPNLLHTFKYRCFERKMTVYQNTDMVCSQVSGFMRKAKTGSGCPFTNCMVYLVGVMSFTGTSQIITVSSTLGSVEHLFECSLRLAPIITLGSVEHLFECSLRFAPIITVNSTLGLVEHLFECSLRFTPIITLGLVEHLFECSLRLAPIITVSSTLGLVEHVFESVLVHAVQCMCSTDL